MLMAIFWNNVEPRRTFCVPIVKGSFTFVARYSPIISGHSYCMWITGTLVRDMSVTAHCSFKQRI